MANPVQFHAVASTQGLCTYPLNSSAFVTGSIDEVKVCLAEGADATGGRTTSYSEKPIYAAARWNADPAAIKARLGAGANVNGFGNYDCDTHSQTITPLDFAILYNGNPQVAITLLEHGACPLFVDPDYFTPLHHAAFQNVDSNIARALLEAGADPNAQHWVSDLFSPLHVAAAKADASFVQVLLQGGADPHVRTVEGMLPLHYALWNNDPGAIDILLAGGANPNARDNNGNTALHNAMVFTVLAELDQLSRVSSDILGRVRTDDVTVFEAKAQALTTGGADSELRNIAGHTPEQLRLELMSYLIDR